MSPKASNRFCESANTRMMFNQKADFRLLLRRKFQALRGAVEGSKAAGDVVFHRHAFAHVVQQQGKNQQVAPLASFPERHIE